MQLTHVFPVLNNDGPIYGFDVIAGKNKMTGAFHDFSPSSDYDNPMIAGYKESVADFIPKKQRQLPYQELSPQDLSAAAQAL